MRALSIRQPFAELILRGTKRIEYRTRPTRIIGERFWIYASKRPAVVGGQKRTAWSSDLALPDQPLPPWMVELAEGLRLWKPGELPVGVIVGSAVIERCDRTRPPGRDAGPPVYAWHLGRVERCRALRKPHGHPQPAWFVPF